MNPAQTPLTFPTSIQSKTPKIHQLSSKIDYTNYERDSINNNAKRGICSVCAPAAGWWTVFACHLQTNHLRMHQNRACLTYIKNDWKRELRWELFRFDGSPLNGMHPVAGYCIACGLHEHEFDDVFNGMLDGPFTPIPGFRVSLNP